MAAPVVQNSNQGDYGTSAMDTIILTKPTGATINAGDSLIILVGHLLSTAMKTGQITCYKTG